jgi:putative peptidoglycan lipid II flippase
MLASLRRPLRSWLTYEFGVPEGSALLMAAFLFSAVLGIVRQVLFNARFGFEFEASAYYAAFRLPETIGTLVAGGTITNALVPVLLRVSHDEGEAAGKRLLNVTLGTLLVVLAPLLLLCALFAPLFVRNVLAPGFDATTSTLTVALTRLMLLEVALVVSEGVLAALLISRGQLLLPAIAIALRNVTLLTGLAASFAFPQIGIYGPTFGAIGDGLLQLLILLPGLHQRGFRFQPQLRPRDPHFLAMLRLAIPSGLSALVNYGGTIIETAFASLARNAAALPALLNSFLLIGLPVRLLGIAIAQAAFPHLAAIAVDADWPRYRRVLLRVLLAATVLATTAMIGLFVAGRWAIALLFERGAFDAAAGDLTYSLLVAYGIGLPSYVLTEILNRSFISLADTRTPLIVNIVQLALRAALMAALLPTLDVHGIAIAFAFGAYAETIVLAVVLWLRLRRR